MDPSALRVRCEQIEYPPRRVEVHPAARGAHLAWREACAVGDRHYAAAMLSDAALDLALACSPIPVVPLEDTRGPIRYGVIGRFAMLHECVRRHDDSPTHPRIALAIIGMGRDRMTTQDIEFLAQALLVAEIGSRCSPVREYASVRSAACAAGGWSVLEPPSPSLDVAARRLGVGRDRLRVRRRLPM